MKILAVLTAPLQQYRTHLSSSFVAYLLAAVINLTASYALMIFLLNVLSKAEYGQYGLYISVFSMVLIIFNFGHKEVVFKYASRWQKKLAQSPLSALFGGFYRWNLCLLLCLQSLLWLDLTLYAVSMMFLCNSWLMTVAAWYRGCADYVKDAWALPLQRLLWLLICIGCYYGVAEFSLAWVFFSALAASALCLAWLYWPQRDGALSLRLIGKKSPNDGQFKLLCSYLLIECCSVFYLKSDVLLLRYFDFELTVMADYFFAIQIFEIAVLVLMPVGYFYLNRLNRLVPGDNEQAALTPMLIWIMTLVILMHGAVAGLAPMVFPLMIPKYLNAINVVLWVMCSLYPVAINILLSSRLIVHHKERSYAKICFIALLFNLLANASLIPRFGWEAVMLVKFLTELLIMGLLLVVCRTLTAHRADSGVG